MNMEIIRFFLCPTLQRATTLKDKLRNTFMAINLTFVSLIVFVISLSIIHWVTKGLNFDYSVMDSTRKFNFDFYARPPFEIFFYGVVVLPLLEELTFRAFLDLKKISIALSIGGIIYFFANILFTVELGAALALIGFAISFFAIGEQAVEFMRSNFRTLFYLSNVSFVFVHAFNYHLSQFREFDYWVLPVLLSLQMIGSLNYSYLRIRNGLAWSYLFHACENFVFLLPYIIGNK
jgi:hypothetical protein